MRSLLKKVFPYAVLLFLVMPWRFRATISEPELTLFLLDVGQGDALFLRTKQDQTLLIDTGAGVDIGWKLGQVFREKRCKIDLLILTHPDRDHIGGTAEVLRRCEVGRLLVSPAQTWSPLGRAVCMVHVCEEVMADAQIPWGDFSLHILSPNARVLEQEKTNDASIVFSLNVYGRSWLFTGDVPSEVEESLVDKVGNIELLKVAHHGSFTASSRLFLETTQPEFALISVGVANPYRHPDLRVVDRLERISADVWRTDREGDVCVFAEKERTTVSKCALPFSWSHATFPSVSLLF